MTFVGVREYLKEFWKTTKIDVSVISRFDLFWKGYKRHIELRWESLHKKDYGLKI